MRRTWCRLSRRAEILPKRSIITRRQKTILARYLGEKSSGYERHLFRGAVLSRMRGEPELAARQDAAVFERDPDIVTKMPSEANRAQAETAHFKAQSGHADESVTALNAILDRIVTARDREYRVDDEADVRFILGTTLIEAGHSADAEQHLRRALEIQRQIDGPDSVWLAQTEGRTRTVPAGRRERVGSTLTAQGCRTCRTAAGTLGARFPRPISCGERAFTAGITNAVRNGPLTNGRGDRIRTCDLVDPNHALYQAELHPENGSRD